MDRYAYMNAVLDANPTVVLLLLNTRTAPYGMSVYDTAVGEPPEGQPRITDRVKVDAGTEEQVNEGFDVGGNLVIRFVC
jgi:hypothetical protein